MNSNKKAAKPPDILRGIMPRYMYDMDRGCNLIDAIERYANAQRHVPEVWYKELRELFVRRCSK